MLGLNVVSSVPSSAKSETGVQSTQQAGPKVDVPGGSLPNERQEVAASVTASSEKPAQKPVATFEAVDAAMQSIGDRIGQMARSLQFSVSDTSGQVVVTVTDKTSDEVIRQIPGETAIAISEHIASLKDDVPPLGLLLDSEV